MQPVIDQLSTVRSRVRFLLILMRCSAWLSAIIAVAITAGFVDYFLRLPAWLRLILAVAGAGYALYWAFKKIGRAVRIAPALTSLALRVEKLQPQTAGQLASAVAFATQTAQHDDSNIARQLAGQTTDEAGKSIDPEQFAQLINPKKPLIHVGLLVLAAACLIGLTVANAQAVSTAFSRWANPLGGAQWPSRYAIESTGAREYAPNDQKVLFSARVTKGDHDRLFTFVNFRFHKTGSETTSWKRVRMTRAEGRSADPHTFVASIDPGGTSAKSVEFYYEAGDARSADTESTRFFTPPKLSRVLLTIQPPDYAEGLVAVKQAYPIADGKERFNTEALIGSTIRMSVSITGSFKPLPQNEIDKRQRIARLLTGLVRPRSTKPSKDALTQPLTDQEIAEFSNLKIRTDELNLTADGLHYDISWEHRKTVALQFNLTDVFGKDYADVHVIRVDTEKDKSPTAKFEEPDKDESVLPTALIPLKAYGSDDVALNGAQITGAQHRGNDPKAKPLADTTITQHLRKANPTDSKTSNTTKRFNLTADLDLSKWKDLKPGDRLQLAAKAWDVFALDGKPNQHAHPDGRTLTIISEHEFKSDIRKGFADLRSGVLDDRTTQENVRKAGVSPENARKQQRLAGDINAKKGLIQKLNDRINRNRFNDKDIKDTLDQASKLLDNAQKAAAEAARNLNQANAAKQAGNRSKSTQAANKAKQKQNEVEKNLDTLARNLDQGEDVQRLKGELVKLSKALKAATADTRKTTPKTIGRKREDLSAAEKKQLDDLAKKQAEIADEARKIAQGLRSAAAALQRQSNNVKDKADAEALKRAADIATREELEKKIQEGAKQSQQNQLAQAQQSQQSAQQTIQRMLQQINKAEQLRQEILKRELMKLVEQIRELKKRQEAHLDRLKEAKVFTGLREPLAQLWQDTMHVSNTARQTSREAGPVADLLDQAAGHQYDARVHLNEKSVNKDDTQEDEEKALAKITLALNKAEELAKKAQKDAGEQDRQKLIAAYTKVLKKQEAVHNETKPLAEAPQAKRNRRHTHSSRKVSTKQTEIRTELKELQEKLENTIVYKSVHDQMDQWAENAALALKNSDSSSRTLFEQQMIIASIKGLIKSLQQDPPDENFAKDDGGGGGGGGKPPLIPPIAELKMLRARQATIHMMTRLFDQNAKQNDPHRAGILKDLSKQQNDLGNLGHQLLRKLNQRRPAPAGPGT